MDHIREVNRRLFSSKSTLFIFRGRRCEDGCIPYRKDQGLHGHVQLPSAGYVAVAESERAFISHAVPAGELGLHHEGPCPYLQGRHRQHQRRHPGAGGARLPDPFACPQRKRAARLYRIHHSGTA